MTHLSQAVSVELYDEPNVDDVAELSPPARQIQTQFKEKHRTHLSGRKKIREPHKRVYKHWKTPFLFKQILLAGKNTKDSAGLSPTGIVKYLQNRDRETFADLAPTTVQGWFDHDDLGRRIWKQSVLEAARVSGNTPGHDRGGRKGALASR